MRLRFYKHDVDFVDLELGGDGDKKMLGMGMKFITVSFSSTCTPYMSTIIHQCAYLFVVPHHIISTHTSADIQLKQAIAQHKTQNILKQLIKNRINRFIVRCFMKACTPTFKGKKRRKLQFRS